MGDLLQLGCVAPSELQLSSLDTNDAKPAVAKLMGLVASLRLIDVMSWMDGAPTACVPRIKRADIIGRRSRKVRFIMLSLLPISTHRIFRDGRNWESGSRC